ncbi:hypothetical protein ACFV27_37070 [Streptomyces antimycoticus]|uniref:hypothetical protein n=1 Tax=Streptomyces antimycoticus TaxID=68175 RepID=UPI00369D5CA0
MTTPLKRAEQAMAEAREEAFRSPNLPALDRLIRAVRRHDAELVRAMDPFEIALAGQHARDDIARALDHHNDAEPKETTTQRVAELKADWSRYRGRVLAEVWEALRDAEGGPLIDGMNVVNKLLEKP